MTWNYRVTRRKVRTTVDVGETVEEYLFELREVYYNEDGSVQSWTEEPVHAVGDTWMELADTLAIMGRAIGIPVLDLDREGGVWLGPPFNRLHHLEE